MEQIRKNIGIFRIRIAKPNAVDNNKGLII
jgi:hypothetical protein